MFASQLLRILQTIPSDVKSETCVDDSAEQNMTMKENQNETLHGSKSFGRDVDLLAFKSKEVYQINGLRKDTNPSPFELNGRDECWNAKFVDDLSMDDQKVTGDSAGEEFQNGLLYRLSSPEKDEYLLSSVPNVKDKAQSGAEHECSLAGDEFVHCNENKSRDSRSPYIAASDPLEKNNNLFNDKIVLKCEPPDLIVCYKEINYHVVKDICVDEGVPVNSHGILPYQGRPTSPESSFDKNTAKDCDQEDSLQKGETNFSASSKTVTHTSEETFLDRNLPIQEFGTRSFLRSFLNSLDDDESKVKQLPEQISSGEVVSGHAPSSAETGPKEDVQASNLQYNSKVETGSITFNFNSPEPVSGGVTNVGTENVKKQSVDSRDSLGREDISSENVNDVSLDLENPVLSSSGEVVNSHVLKHEHTDPDNDAVISLRRFDEGELSFSTSDLINYSGPIAYSGNLSEGSATSGRSFAFPTLQPEWSSSPVRMTKADRRHFRKHKGWRSGLLCCRF